MAGLQSLCLLFGCVIIMAFAHNQKVTMIQVNRPELETSSSNYEEDSYSFRVAIDPGHGGIDSGTLGIDHNCEEKEINLAVAKLVWKKIEEEPGIKVHLSRYDDRYLSPEERTKWLNSSNCDICISIHCNSADNLDATGVEVLYHGGSGGKKDSKELAERCLDAILEQTSQINRGLLNGDSIYIIRNAKMPIALIEVGFLSNQQELTFLRKYENQVKIADGIVNAIKHMKERDNRNEKNSICNY